MQTSRQDRNLITLTRDLAFAAGQDAANKAMRIRIGQHPKQALRWNADERDIATSVTNELLLYVPVSAGGLDGFDLTAKQRADLLISDEKWGFYRERSMRCHNGGPALAAAA